MNNFESACKSITAIVLVLIITSCTTMYVPTMQAVPMFENKGDLQATVSTRNVQLAYAPTNGFGFFLDAYNRNGKPFVFSDDKAGSWHLRSYAMEGAVGIFQKQETYRTEIFVGYGQGFSSITYWEGSSSWRAEHGGSSSFNKYFIQPNVSFGNGDIKGSFSLRLSSLNFYNFQDLNGATISHQAIFFEPSFTLRKKIEFMSFKVQLQYSAVSSDFSDHNSKYVPYKNSALLFLGIDVHLNELFPKE